MPFKIACPAGHKLVIAGNGAEGPLVCPRCGLPATADLASVDPSVVQEGTDATESPCASAVDVDAEAAGGTAASGQYDAPPVAVSNVSSRLPVIRVQPKSELRSSWKPGPGAFAIIAAVAALGSALPAIAQLAQAFRVEGAGSGIVPARWALLLVWLATLQAAYGVYCWLWADWSSRQLATAALIAQAGVYAAVLAIVLLANPHGWILGQRGLQLTAAVQGGKAALVCLSLICLCAILALFGARAGASAKPGFFARR